MDRILASDAKDAGSIPVGCILGYIWECIFMKDNSKSVVVQDLADFGKILVAAQAAVKRVKVSGVVAVRVALQGQVKEDGLYSKLL